MKRNDLILKLYSLPQTVFSLRELGLMFTEIKYVNLKRRLNNLVKTNKLESPARGIFAKSNFVVYELACKLYSPTYISLESVLAKEGIIFQKYESVFAISYINREIKLSNKITINYKRLKGEILNNKLGVDRKQAYFVASPERAFTDAVYIYRDYYFDNLAGLDWDKVFEISKIYKSKILVKRLESYYKLTKNNV